MSYFLTTGEDQNKQHWTFWTPIKATYLRQSWRYKDSKAGSWDSKAKCGVVNGALRTNRIPIKFHKLGAHTVLAFRCDGASTARALMLDCWNSATAERGCDSHHEGSTAGGLRACPHTATGRATNVRTFFPCFKATRASRRYNENGSTARLLQRHRATNITLNTARSWDTWRLLPARLSLHHHWHVYVLYLLKATAAASPLLITEHPVMMVFSFPHLYIWKWVYKYSACSTFHIYWIMTGERLKTYT